MEYIIVLANGVSQSMTEISNMLTRSHNQTQLLTYPHNLILKSTINMSKMEGDNHQVTKLHK